MPGVTDRSPISTLAVAVAAMFWGVDLLFRPEVLKAGWSPALVVLAEHLLLTLVFSVVLWQGRRSLATLSPSQWSALLFVAWGGSALATWLYTKAFTLGSPLTAILLQKTQPLFAILLAGRVLGERRAPMFWGWLTLALVGTFLLTAISLKNLPTMHDLSVQQSLAALGAAALWGSATVAGRVLTSALPPSLLAGARFALAVPLLLVIALFSPQGPIVSALIPHALLFLGLIVALPDLAGMALYYVGLRGTPASVATIAELCYPLTSLLIGVFVQRAYLSPAQWIGFVVLVIAVLALGRRPQVSVKETPMAHAGVS